MSQKKKPRTDWASMRKRHEEGVPLDLPSGYRVFVRNVSAFELLSEGKIPDQLTPLVSNMIYGGSETDLANMSSLKALGELMNIICRAALVKPRIVDTPQKDDEIGVYHLDDEDKEVIYGLLGLPSRQLESFCKEQSERLQAMGDSEGVPDTAE